MYAVIECGGKQYRVQEGDLIRVEKIEAEVGTTLNIDKVLLLGGDQTVIGNPFVSGASVTCRVLNHDKEKKVLVFHYKAKKNIRKRYGHRQPFTSLLVEGILQNGQVVGKKGTKKAASEAEKAEKTEKAEAQA